MVVQLGAPNTSTQHTHATHHHHQVINTNLVSRLTVEAESEENEAGDREKRTKALSTARQIRGDYYEWFFCSLSLLLDFRFKKKKKKKKKQEDFFIGQ